MPSYFKRPERPTGIIRTLPYFGAPDAGHCKEAQSKAYRYMMRSLKAVESGKIECFYVAFPQRPTTTVLHCYLIVGGKVRVRANIASWIPGDQIGTVTCWDDSERTAKWWAALTAPISWPPEDVLRRGFQGFRYCGDLW